MNNTTLIRFWNDQKDEMIYGKVVTETAGNGIEVQDFVCTKAEHDYSWRFLEKNCVQMNNVGQDRNGQEIYEKDVIEFTSLFNTDELIYAAVGISENVDLSVGRLVGNLYQNSELKELIN